MYDSVIRAESGVLWKNNAGVGNVYLYSGDISLHFLITKIRWDSEQINALASSYLEVRWGVRARGGGAIIPSQPPCYHIPIW